MQRAAFAPPPPLPVRARATLFLHFLGPTYPLSYPLVTVAQPADEGSGGQLGGETPMEF